MDLHNFRQDYLENLIINNKIHWWNAVLVLNNVRSSCLQTNSKVRNAFYQWMVFFMIKISIQSCLISYVYIVICFLRSCSCDFIHLDNRLSLFNSACGQLHMFGHQLFFIDVRKKSQTKRSEIPNHLCLKHHCSKGAKTL